ncbi:MAG TPA: hypothetical protein VK658_01415 [Chryseolinea sp.]|nr:hypothetical protein [Chryseolinea sp.]
MKNITGIADEVDELISVYPVPAGSYLRIEDVSNQNVVASLVDTRGANLLTTNFSGQSRSTFLR